VTLSALWKDDSLAATLAFALVTLVFVYTLIANIIERPDGIKVASFFIAAIIIVSLASRIRRSLELRQERIEIDQTARRFIEEASEGGEIHIIAHRRRFGDDPEEYARKLVEQREYNHIPEDAPVLFLEIDVEDPSEFEDVLEVRGVEIGDYKVLRAESSAVPNAIAAFLIHLRDTIGKAPHCYFGWTEGNPFVYVIRYILFGEGDTPRLPMRSCVKPSRTFKGAPSFTSAVDERSTYQRLRACPAHTLFRYPARGLDETGPPRSVHNPQPLFPRFPDI
jgi:hypothetical protein